MKRAHVGKLREMWWKKGTVVGGASVRKGEQRKTGRVEVDYRDSRQQVLIFVWLRSKHQ